MGFRLCCFCEADSERRVLLKKEYRSKKDYPSRRNLPSMRSEEAQINVSSIKSSHSDLLTNWLKNTDFRVPPTGLIRQRSGPEYFCEVKSCPVKHAKICIKSSKSVLSPYVSPHDDSAYTVSFSTYVPIPMTKILPHLYVGTYENAINEVELRAKNITHILSLIGHRSHLGFVKHEHFPMCDHGKTELKRVLVNVSEFIKQGQKDGNNLLVHCHRGQNRSPSLILAHLMMNQKKTLWRLHRELKNLRPIVHINASYAKQLLDLEKEIHHKNSLPRDWMEREAIDEKSGMVTYNYEHMDTEHHKAMFQSDELT